MDKFKQRLASYIDSKRIIDDPMLCYAYGTDASVYRITPKLVVQVENNQEVTALINLANEFKIHITFRAAGTSLSGQALGEEVLVVLSNSSWQNYHIRDEGKQISLEPGIIGAHANLYLKPFATKIGPDPASINACKIGGIVANNSSGMCCGISKNSYNTLAGLKLILANGSMLDTQNADSCNKFIQQNPEIVEGLQEIREQIIANPQLADLIRHKFKIKNTSGYSLNAFLDFADPLEILSHLMIGSEGTLGFISEVTYNCVPDNPFKAVALVFCDELDSIVSLTGKFNSNDISAIELLDITSLNSLKNLPVAKKYLPRLSEDTAAILIEISGATAPELEQKTAIVQAIIDNHPIQSQIKFTDDVQIYNDLWALRKGILPTIGGARQSGSSVVIEDVAVSINQLVDLVRDLRSLFKRHNYTNAAIFGHILSGNIHFVFTPRFDIAAEIENYKIFMDSMCRLVTNKYQGSLKAEHGSGRNIAPFAELEWGSAAYKIMWQVKMLLDPNSILNPDVKLTKNPNLHMENLKQLYPTDPIIDKCIECGFCEVVCPSKKLTLTPRQRISTYRQMGQLNSKKYEYFAEKYKYHGIETCATTGLCQNNCPVGINTGEFILKLKQKSQSFPVQQIATHFSWFVNLNKYLLNLGNFAANIIGRKSSYTASKKLHKAFPIIPIFLPTLPDTQKAKFINSQSIHSKKVMYFPSCNNRIFGDTSTTDRSNKLQDLIGKLGYTIIYPQNLKNLCCGQLFSSKGNNKLAESKADELIEELKTADFPVIMDNSSCFYSLKKQLVSTQRDDSNTHMTGCNIVDPVDFIHDNLNQLNLQQKYTKLALHIDCSSTKLGQEAKIRQILAKCAKEIILPVNISCCGFAGDKGLKLPELNQAALHGLKEQVADCEAGVTFNRNCQIGLSFYSNKTYLSLPEIILNCLE